MKLVSKIATAVATITVLAAAAIPAYAAVTAYDGPMRWEVPSVTVTDTTGEVDVEAISAAWGDTVEIVPVDGPADITFVKSGELGTLVGGEAHRVFKPGTTYITSCAIQVEEALPELLTHEFGHCLGLSHNNMQRTGANMHWFSKDYQNGWSDTVTANDLSELARHYR